MTCGGHDTVDDGSVWEDESSIEKGRSSSSSDCDDDK
jgi:hypothetical protein